MSLPADSAQDRLARKRSLARRGFAYRLLCAIGLIVLTLVIGRHPGLEFSEGVSGLAALAAVIGTVDAGLRAYRINVGSPRKPRVTVSALPDENSLAFTPLARLAARERELADHVAALPAAVSVDTWGQAAAAAGALRIHAARITAAEDAGGGIADASDLELLASRLREGVSAYERLTITAGELTGQDSGKQNPANATARLADATDSLVGMTRGLAS